MILNPMWIVGLKKKRVLIRLYSTDQKQKN